MNDELNLMLEPLITDYYLTTILSVNSLLEQFGMLDHHYELNQIIGLQDAYGDEALLVGRIDDCLRTGVYRLFGQYGIIVNEVAIAEYLPLLETLANAETILVEEELDISIISDPGCYEVAVLVERYSGVHYLRILEWLVEVDSKQIKAIFEDRTKLLNVPAVEDAGEQKALRPRYARLAKIITMAPERLVIQDMLDVAEPLNTSWASVLELNLEELDYMSVELRAWNLLAFYYYTDGYTLFKDPQSFIQDYTDDITEYRLLFEYLTPFFNSEREGQ